MSYQRHTGGRKITVAATLAKQITQAAPALASVAPDLPAHLTEAVDRCLAKDPAERYDGMSDLMDDLAACLDIPADQFRSVSQTHSSIQREVPPPGRGRAGSAARETAP